MDTISPVTELYLNEISQYQLEQLEVRSRNVRVEDLEHKATERTVGGRMSETRAVRGNDKETEEGTRST